jgi:peptidoglycan/xylan/chitin deacetylase (PgdA/CDA1 family)
MAGTFYVLREPFAGVPQGPAILRWLVAHGFELGDHTYDHIPLNTLDATKVQQELVRGAQVITKAVPGYRIRTMALPLGALPHPRSLAVRGSWNGVSYGPFAVLLDGAQPAPSPYSTKWDAGAIPRIRSSQLPWHGESDFTWNMWLRQLTDNLSIRYVSDGDPKHVTFPRDESSALAPRFRALARPD